MSCRALCLTCKSAGLKSCPFVVGSPLPLVDAEKPKVTYTRNVVYPARSVPWDPRIGGAWKP